MKKYEVEVVREFYTYVTIEADEDDIQDFNALEADAVDKAMNLRDSIELWYERRAAYAGLITDITGRR